LIYGINPVLEALRARRVKAIRVSSRTDERLAAVLRLADEQGIAVRRVTTEELDRAARSASAHRAPHQGIVADVRGSEALTVEDLVSGARGPALLVVLDGIEDPHNVGAILRTCDAAGVTGVIRQTRHSAALDGVVGKASAGALAHARIATVVNIARAVEALKDANIWTIGLAGDAAEAYTDIDWTLPSAIVLGAEGTGLRRLVRERCDRLVRVPMLGRVESLNVSVAAGVVLYEAVRQRIGLSSGKG